MDERAWWDADFISLARIFKGRRLPLLESGSDPEKGNLRKDVLDGTGLKAVRVAASGMRGGTVSPTRPWFDLALQDLELSKHTPVREWLDIVRTRMMDVLHLSNFYDVTYDVYKDLIVFGTHFVFENPDPTLGVWFRPLPVGSYVLDVNEKGMVDTVGRVFEHSALNIVRQFGYPNCSQSVKRAYDKPSTQLKKFKVVHMVLPNDLADHTKRTNHFNKWSSYYFELESPGDDEYFFLHRSGYDMFPGFGPRWDIDGDGAYGCGPAMDSLGDGKMLQSVRATYLKQEHKKADPPMVVPEGVTHYNKLPGGVTPVNTQNQTNPIYPAEQTNPDTRGILEITQDVRHQIREGLYNDLFRMLSSAPYNSKMTATEVAERHEEKLLQLGPVLERLHSEFFHPLIDRTFDIMLKQDLLPPPPEEIQGMDLKVDFVSLLAKAQKLVNTNAVDQFMGFLGANAPMLPELLDIVDPDKVGDGYADYVGIETKMLRSQEDRDQIRETRNQQVQMQQAAEMAGPAIQAAKTLADTPMQQGETNGLDELIGGVIP